MKPLVAGAGEAGALLFGGAGHKWAAGAPGARDRRRAGGERRGRIADEGGDVVVDVVGLLVAQQQVPALSVVGGAVAGRQARGSLFRRRLPE